MRKKLTVGFAGQQTDSLPKFVTLPKAALLLAPAQLGIQGTVRYDTFQTPKSV
jgi:hypothetical protein